MSFSYVESCFDDILIEHCKCVKKYDKPWTYVYWLKFNQKFIYDIWIPFFEKNAVFIWLLTLVKAKKNKRIIA